MIRGIEDLVRSQRTLDENLQAAAGYLGAIHADRRRLVEELDRARHHGFADEVTGLPNRAAFLRQLESEVGRVCRYGLSLALIDVDDFGAIDDRHGCNAGNAVPGGYGRKCYRVSAATTWLLATAMTRLQCRFQTHNAKVP